MTYEIKLMVSEAFSESLNDLWSFIQKKWNGQSHFPDEYKKNSNQLEGIEKVDETIVEVGSEEIKVDKIPATIQCLIRFKSLPDQIELYNAVIFAKNTNLIDLSQNGLISMHCCFHDEGRPCAIPYVFSWGDENAK